MTILPLVRLDDISPMVRPPAFRLQELPGRRNSCQALEYVLYFVCSILPFEEVSSVKYVRKIISWGLSDKLHAILLTLILLTCLVPLYVLTQYAIPFYDGN